MMIGNLQKAEIKIFTYYDFGALRKQLIIEKTSSFKMAGQSLNEIEIKENDFL